MNAEILRPRFIFVADRPYRVWPASIVADSQMFLEGLYPAYFEQMADFLEANGSDKEAWPIHLTARMIYGQATEAFLALVFSMFQAPFDTAAWLLLYQRSDLKWLLDRFERGEEFPRLIELPEPGWDGLGRFLFPLEPGDGGLVSPQEHVEKIVRIWKLLADEFRNPVATAEYNSIKHGFRARAGGQMLVLGGSQLLASDHGTWFPVLQKQGSDILLRAAGGSWSVSGLCGRLRVIASSAQNLLNLLRALNTPAHNQQSVITVPGEEELAAASPRPRIDGSFTMGPSFTQGAKFPPIDRDVAKDWYRKRVIRPEHRPVSADASTPQTGRDTDQA